MRNNPSKIKMLWSNLVALVIGIPTPYGRVKPGVFLALKGLSDEVNSLRIKYDYALKTNEDQANYTNRIHLKALEYHSDAAKLSQALKELVNHPNILSPESKEVIDSFKVKDNMHG